MISFQLYSRDTAGNLTRSGRVQHFSLSEFLEWCGRDTETPETETLGAWPESSVTWYGNIGIADIQQDRPFRVRSRNGNFDVNIIAHSADAACIAAYRDHGAHPACKLSAALIEGN